MASDRVVNRAGFQLIIRSGSVTRLVNEAVTKALTQIGKNFERQIIKNISQSDHTLADLRSMGHPYAEGKPSNTVHGDDRIVHEQTGKLIKSIKFHPVEETSSRRFSIFISSDSPYMPYLIYGTSTMRPRNFPQLAYEQIKDKFWQPLYDALDGIRYRIEGK